MRKIEICCLWVSFILTLSTTFAKPSGESLQNTPVYVRLEAKVPVGEGTVDTIWRETGIPERISVRKNCSYIDSIPIVFSTAEYLTISGYSLPILPCSILAMKKLQSLFLDNCRIEVFCRDSSINCQIRNLYVTNCTKFNIDLFFNNNSTFDSLEYLSLSQDSIKELPPKIKMFKHLRMVVLSDNLLEDLPDELFELPNIKYVSFDGNPIKHSGFLKYRGRKEKPIIIFY